MCAIFGLFAPGGADPDIGERALAAMRHRGPDATDLWRSRDGQLVLGHARLKILDLSDSANQPMRSADGRWTLVFNGEIVNFKDVRACYRGPWQFRTNGDSEVLLAAFASRGLAALDDMVGMFAFAIHDAERKQLTLVRDRFGIKPLYLVDLPDRGMAFASEITALLPLLSDVKADRDVIRTYLETGLYDHTQRTFFAGVTALSPGTALQLDLSTGERRVTRWYDVLARGADLTDAGETELIAEGARVIEMAIRDHLIADVGVGLNVSGGVDSSLLVGIARNIVGDIHLFSQDYEAPYSEARFVAEVADGCQLHTVSLSSDDILRLLDATVRSQAEPFGGITVCGYDALYRAAKAEGITVLLDGNGVDEVFLGYQRYHARHVAAQPLEAAWRSAADDYEAFWQVRAPQFGSGNMIGGAIDGTVGTAPQAISTRLIADTVLLQHCRLVCDDPVRGMACEDLLATKIPRGLRFNDRVSMASSRELRVPFLDHRVVEFGLALPSAALLNGKGSKALFRSLAERWVPTSLTRARKRSVQSPQREWLATSWRPLVIEILGSGSLAERGWIDPVAARAAYDSFCTGTGDNSFFIWQWLNLELWARAFLDASPSMGCRA